MNLGQVFTSSKVSDYMVSQFSLPKDAKILDPCFGNGAFLLSLKKSGFTNVTGMEIDSALFEKVKKEYGNYNIIKGDYLSSSLGDIDGVIMNPPYIRHEIIDELEPLGITKRLLRKNPIYRNLPSTANIYMYFIIKAISQLKEGGQLVVIFPSTWMKARSGEAFMNILKEKCVFEKEVHISGDVFENNVLVDVIILKLVKGKGKIRTKYESFDFIGGVKKTPNKQIKEIGFDIPLSIYASIRRGLTTGFNKMYVNPSVEAAEKYIKKMISTPKAARGYNVDNAELDDVLIIEKGEVLSKPVKEYLDLWKDFIIQQKAPKTLLSKIGLEEWYVINPIDSRGILFSYIIRSDMKFLINNTEFIARDNFYIIKPYIDTFLMFALLNNYYTYYQLEFLGKKYGAGLLKIQKYDFDNVYFPDINNMKAEDVNKLRKLGSKLSDTGKTDIIKDINRVISPYSKLSADEIEQEYLQIKRRRLEGK